MEGLRDGQEEDTEQIRAALAAQKENVAPKVRIVPTQPDRTSRFLFADPTVHFNRRTPAVRRRGLRSTAQLRRLRTSRRLRRRCKAELSPVPPAATEESHAIRPRRRRGSSRTGGRVAAGRGAPPSSRWPPGVLTSSSQQGLAAEGPNPP